MPDFYQHIARKIVSSDKGLSIVNEWKSQGKRIVFTNGCFDLIHLGHLYYLAEAAALGDKLIVAINSDQSVQRLKGKTRPVKDEQTRLNLMASLEVVDLVLCFDYDTPLRLIESIIPDVLVKGGDWSISEIVGSDIVLQNNGKVQSLTFIEGHSSTAIIEKIKNIEG